MMLMNRRGVLAGGLAAAVLPGSEALGALSATEPKRRMAPKAIGTAERMARIARARVLMEKAGIGAVLVEAGASLDYFAGFAWNRSERLTGLLIPREGEPVVVTPFFELATVTELLGIPAAVRTWHEHESPFRLVTRIMAERGLAAAPIGLEHSVRHFIRTGLEVASPRTKLVSADPVVAALRMIKTPAEIALMQYASDLTLDAIAEVHPRIRPGVGNREVAAMLQQAMVDRGGSNPWALVLFGAAAALPHGTGRPLTLQAGQMVLIDTGCSFGGYQSDISRSFVVGARPSAEQRRVWEQVAAGQQIAWRALKVGAPAGSVDDAVRTAYARWGYGPDYQLPGLSHRTGHGIGMEGHEPINLVRGERTRLAPGMCFSNEPGIYLPGKFGVRLEDCFYMTAAGPRWFSVPPATIDDPIGRSGA
ncbi:aminopeptidase P family protein [Sphingomonas xanthus]|uniref:Aminopeptidase P family protein n=2 Tax=Sphingomonas xanthus TaxID=2594473 RepID=A0A516IUM1_9SPHN|nr:aminopeptidase P family protein [Sphingomonas xanthus]